MLRKRVKNKNNDFTSHANSSPAQNFVLLEIVWQDQNLRKFQTNETLKANYLGKRIWLWRPKHAPPIFVQFFTFTEEHQASHEILRTGALHPARWPLRLLINASTSCQRWSAPATRPKKFQEGRLPAADVAPTWPAGRNMRENWETTGQPPPPGMGCVQPWGRTGWGRQRWLTDETVPASVFMCVCVYLPELRTPGMKSRYIRAPWGTHQEFRPDPGQEGFSSQWRGRGWGSTHTRKGERENCVLGRWWGP